jgi:hypothetical protein
MKRQKTTSENLGLVEQYFETNNIFINLTKTLQVYSLLGEKIQARK